MSNKAVFFDRDGVINARIVGGYVRTFDEFEFLKSVGDVLKAVKARGYLAVVITNQRGVGRGLMSLDDLHEIHDKMQQHVIENYGVQFDDVFYAIDADDASERRKPSPAMLIEAAEKWDIDLPKSWMVGDSTSDIVAGRRAGTKTAFLVTRHTEAIPDADLVIHTLPELLKYI